MTGRINKENKTITELPTMDKPSIKDQKYWTNNGTKPDFELLETANKMYAEHLAGLKTFSYSGEWKAETGDTVSFTTGYQMTTWKKEVWYDCSKAAYDNTVDDSRRIVAIPLPDKQPDEKEHKEDIPECNHDWYYSRIIESRMCSICKVVENFGQAHKQDSEDVNQAAEAAAMNIFGADNDKIHDRGNYYNGFVDGYKHAKQQPSTYTGEREAIANCSGHKKEVLGIADMKVLAEMISDLHYESFSHFMVELGIKVYMDSNKDYSEEREQLAHWLMEAQYKIQEASGFIYKAWQVSKRFMK